MIEEYLHLFDTKSAHDAVYNGANYKEPWVGYIENDDMVTFNKIIDYRDIVGSVAYFDGRRVKFTSKDAWESSLGTPIGVVVIPASHMPDGKCRVMSLCNMSYVTPETGTLGTGNTNASTNGTNLLWGISDTSLTNYAKVMNKDGVLIDLGYLANDFIKGKTSVYVDGDTTYQVSTQDNLVDTATAWCSQIGTYTFDSSGFTISPYLSDGSQNPVFITTGQALSDMDGKANTEVLVNLSAIKDTYTSGAFENAQANYPAAFACNLFSTVGTSQGDWYLPSVGELCYLIARYDLVNETLVTLGSSNAVKIGNYVDNTSYGASIISSSEKDNYDMWTVSYNVVMNTSKVSTYQEFFRVRSFIAL